MHSAYSPSWEQMKETVGIVWEEMTGCLKGLILEKSVVILGNLNPKAEYDKSMEAFQVEIAMAKELSGYVV